MNKAYTDVLERAVRAFAEGALGGIVFTRLTDSRMWIAAVMAGASAVVSLLTSYKATRVGNPESASLSKKI